MKAPKSTAPAPRDPPYAAPIAALLVLCVYAALCPSVSGPGDGSEFTLVLATNGVAHPTGYPLYTLFGHGFVTLLHVAGVAWPLGANLWSAVGAAVAIGFLFALASGLARTVPRADRTTRLLAAGIPTLLFAFQPILLADATAGEVNSWSVAWACATGWLFVRLGERLASPGGELRGAVAWGLLCGAGLAHHLTSVLVSVPLTVALVATAVRARRAWLPLLLVAAIAACLPVASYAIIAWRAWHPAAVQWPALAPGVSSVLDHVTGEQYRHYVGYFAPAPDQRALIDHVALPFLAAGFAALLALCARANDAGARTAAFAFTAAAALVTAFTFRYGVPDPAPYFLPAMAFGAAALAPLLAALVAPLRRSAAAALGAAALAALLVVVPWVRDGAARQREIADYEKLVRSMWAAVPADSSIVFWPDDRYIHLREYQLLLGEKPGLTVLCPDLLLDDQTRARLTRRFGADPIAGNPIPSIVPGSPDADLRIRQYFKQVIGSFNERIATPVIVFDPSVPIVQQMRKP